MIFTENQIVSFKEQTGIVRFICDSYITICVRTFPEKSRDVCILAYREQFKQIQVIK